MECAEDSARAGGRCQGAAEPVLAAREEKSSRRSTLGGGGDAGVHPRHRPQPAAGRRRGRQAPGGSAELGALPGYSLISLPEHLLNFGLLHACDRGTGSQF